MAWRRRVDHRSMIGPDTGRNGMSARQPPPNLRFRLGNGSMADSAHLKTAHGDLDHGFADIDASFVVAYEAVPACKLAEGSLDEPTAGQHYAELGIDARHHFNDEVEESALVQHLPAIVGAVGKKTLDPWTALADGLEDHLRAGAAGDVGRREIDHQQPPISVDRDVAIALDLLLGRIIASLNARRRCLDGVAVDKAGAQAGLAPGPLAIEHQRDVVDRAKQPQPYKVPDPPVERLPGRKVLRKLPPATARARHIADRVENLAQVNARPTAPPGRLRQQRCNPLPFLICETGPITLRLPLNRASRLLCPLT